jgi:integrase
LSLRRQELPKTLTRKNLHRAVNEINDLLITKVNAMRNLAYQLKTMCDRNKSGSHSSQASRRCLCSKIANNLEQLGFRNLDIGSLKPKHVEALVAHWKAEQLAIGSIKNLMTTMRFWAEHVGKENVVKRSNRDYGIGDRTFVTNVSKATVVDGNQLAHVTDPYTHVSLRLEREFGLRREESIKIRPAWADCGDRLRLKDSWTKGGKAREIPITTEAQRAALDTAKALAGKSSLIPKGMRYKDQLERFKAQCAQAGVTGVHGQRHRYAQERYEALTGWKTPACGGPTSKQFTPEQKARDRAARMVISKELGHEREQITAVYLGR